MTTYLLTAAAIGFVWLVFLFLLCFSIVHGIRLAKFDRIRRKDLKGQPKPPEKPEEEQKAPANPQEPIYYIVEKKHTRQKAKYGEPKEIRFK